MSYKVKLDIFEGPFDLLVYLIESAEMSIYDIQVSQITKQYMQYMERMQASDVVLGGEFMVLASVLIEIKSKMLLPRVAAQAEEGIIEDPRTELVQRLLEYKQFKAASELLERQQEHNARILEKPKEDLTQFSHGIDEYLNLDLAQFVKAFNLFLSKKKKVEEIKKYYDRVERQKVSVETKIEQIRNAFLFKGKKLLTFHELLTPESDRYDIVLTFSSMLEMIRQRTICVKQLVNFGEITLSLGGEEEWREVALYDQQEDSKISV